MSKLTLTTLFCAALLVAALVIPASALPADQAPKTRSQCGERVAAPDVDAAKIAFVQSLARESGKQPARSPRRPSNTKAQPTECTGDGTWTRCCGSCGCCTWYGDGNGPVCKSWC